MPNEFKISETAEFFKASATDVVRQARHVASQLNAYERAVFVRDLVHEVINAVKLDALLYGSARQGVEWESEALGRVYAAAASISQTC